MDYKQLGFKAGLEIHQQLEAHKLFCNCPSIVHDENPDIFFSRKLRAVAGESGKVDIAAEYEIKKERIVKYEACSTSSCLVEMDEQPPFPVNRDALKIALQVAMLLNAKIVDEVQVMRKTVVDGSNVSGFQRTMLIATDGFIETSKGRVSIPTVCLEEEAAKKISEKEHEVTFRLDRLGVPLVEIATGPDIVDPDHAKETAAFIGMVLRSTGRVKRGIGTIRQDVNVSIKGHPRVEIKGFQELRSMPKVIDFEVKRQLNVLKKGEKAHPHVRWMNVDGSSRYLRPMPGAARMYPETDVKTIKITKELLGSIEIPELLTELAVKFEKKYSLNADLAREVIEEKGRFEDYVSKFKNIPPAFIANALVNYPKEIQSRYRLDPSKISASDFEKVLEHLNKGEIAKEAVLELMVQLADGKKLDISKFRAVDEKDLESALKKIIKDNKGASINALMGEAMKVFRGKVDGRKVMEILRRLCD